LTIDEAVVERAKLYAMQTGRSLSKLVENYLMNLTAMHYQAELSPRLKQIVGSVQLPGHFKEEEERHASSHKNVI
jgi:hypothetical protein